MVSEELEVQLRRMFWISDFQARRERERKEVRMAPRALRGGSIVSQRHELVKLAQRMGEEHLQSSEQEETRVECDSSKA